MPEKDKFRQSVKVLIISFNYDRNDHVLDLKFEFAAFLLFDCVGIRRFVRGYSKL